MSQQPVNIARRRAIKALGASLAAIPVLLIDASGQVSAAELPELEEGDAQASALGYLHDSSKVDAGKYPNHAPEQNCANCQLIQSAEGEWRPCAIFPGKAVNEKGWCSAWVKKVS